MVVKVLSTSGVQVIELQEQFFWKLDESIE